jgi:hypothetical protein
MDNTTDQTVTQNATPTDASVMPADTSSNVSQATPQDTTASPTPPDSNLGAPTDGSANNDGQGVNVANPQPVSTPTSQVPQDAPTEMPQDNASIYANQAPGVAIAKDPQGNGIVPIPSTPSDPLTVSQNENGDTVYSRPISPSDVLESQGIIQITDPNTGMNYQLTKDQAQSRLKELKALEKQLGGTQ